MVLYSIRNDAIPSQRRVPGSRCSPRSHASGGRVLPAAVLLLLLAIIPGSILGQDSVDPPAAGKICLVVHGLAGVPEYEENFVKWAQGVKSLCQDQVKAEVIVVDGSEARRDFIMSTFEEVSRRTGLAEIWVFLIGHGTFDGRDYKFNVKGPDVTGSDLSAFLDSVGTSKVYFLAATSSSGTLAKSLQSANRIVLTATKSDRERQPPLFISFFLEGALSAEADTNKDRKVSLAEVFAFCETRIAAWYKEKGRIQSEHPILADGDSTPAAFAYLSEPPEQAYRTLEARNLAPERIRLEREVEDLKLHKMDLTIDEYYQKLEALLVELATLNEKIRELEGRP